MLIIKPFDNERYSLIVGQPGLEYSALNFSGLVDSGIDVWKNFCQGRQSPVLRPRSETQFFLISLCYFIALHNNSFDN